MQARCRARAEANGLNYWGFWRCRHTRYRDVAIYRQTFATGRDAVRDALLDDRRATPAQGGEKVACRLVDIDCPVEANLHRGGCRLEFRTARFFQPPEIGGMQRSTDDDATDPVVTFNLYFGHNR